MGESVIAALSALVGYAWDSIWEIDEMESIKNPDGTITVTFLTTGLHPDTAKIKTLVWALTGLPVQRPEQIEIEELQSGPILKRFKIRVTLRPIHESIRRGEGLGVLDVIMNRNVVVKR